MPFHLFHLNRLVLKEIKMFLSEKEQKEYYEQSEREMRNIDHDSSKMHTPSIETSPVQPYKRGGCPLLIFTIILKILVFVSIATIMG